VENGVVAVVAEADGAERVSLHTREPEPREIDVDTREFSDMRLAYAQHVYKAQGLTVDRAFVLAGGWQTDRERAYVALTRARERTDVYLARDDLGEEGLDDGAIARLAGQVARSRAQSASITHQAVERQPESEVGRILREQRELEQARTREEGLRIAL
jgi:ATP-dependent exoDNAse (exonuclease V) alpha subunit